MTKKWADFKLNCAIEEASEVVPQFFVSDWLIHFMTSLK